MSATEFHDGHVVSVRRLAAAFGDAGDDSGAGCRCGSLCNGSEEIDKRLRT